MSAALRFALLLALAVWIGGIVFFSFFTAPALFGVLPREAAGRVTAAIFPRYYVLGVVCGGVALLAVLLLRWRAPAADRGLPVAPVLLFLMLALTFYARIGILPEASSLRARLHAEVGTPGADEARRRFEALHRRAVILNGMVLAGGVGVLALLARRDRVGYRAFG
jgi:hypothetical protein